MNIIVIMENIQQKKKLQRIYIGTKMWLKTQYQWLKQKWFYYQHQ